MSALGFPSRAGLDVRLFREVQMSDHPRTDVPAPRVDDDESTCVPDLRGRRVLVTGARGFIGSHLSRHLLDAGAEVHAVIRPDDPRPPRRIGLPSRPRVTWHECDLTEPDDVRAAFLAIDPTVVFHLASLVQGQRDPALVLPMLEDNTRAAVNIMTAAHEMGNRRVLLAGSVEEPHAADEAPCSPYAAAKGATTTYARLFADQWDLPVTVLRLAMVYGPAQTDERKLVPYVITSLLEGHVPRLASGRRPIDWIYVDDVCQAFLTAATHPDAPGLVVDIGSGTATTIARSVDLIAALVGYDGDLGFGQLEERRNDIARIADLHPAAQVLGWRPRTSLVSGLGRTVAWYRARHARARRDAPEAVGEVVHGGSDAAAVSRVRPPLRTLPGVGGRWPVLLEP